MMGQAWPFLRQERPVIVDWLPWSHTFGGNHNVNMMLSSGGTLYVNAMGDPEVIRANQLRSAGAVPMPWSAGSGNAGPGCWPSRALWQAGVD
jgi:acyl-CoA synthetase (AMP-forming)/AMP-acid ligase II